MSIDPLQLRSFVFRISNAERYTGVIIESLEIPDINALYRQFVAEMNPQNDEQLHIKFAAWLVNTQGAGRCKVIDFAAHNPAFVKL